MILPNVPEPLIIEHHPTREQPYTVRCRRVNHRHHYWVTLRFCATEEEARLYAGREAMRLVI